MESTTLAILLILPVVLIMLRQGYILSRRKKTNALMPPEASGGFPIVGHLCYLTKKPLHRKLMQLAQSYGNMFCLRLGNRYVVVVSSASIAEKCLQMQDLSNRPRLPSGRIIAFEWSTMGTVNYGEHMIFLRRVAKDHLLSTQQMRELSWMMARELRSFLVGLFRHGGGVDKRVELKSRLFELLMNLLMAMMCGKKNSGADGDEEARWFRVMVQETMALSGLSNTWDFMPAPLRWMDIGGLGRRLQKLCASRTAFLQRLIDEQRASMDSDTQSPSTMISAMLSKQQRDPERYNDNVIRSLLVSLLEAGTSTTADTIEWAMSLLLNHDDAMRRVVAEIQACVSSQTLLTASDLARLPSSTVLSRRRCDYIHQHRSSFLMKPPRIARWETMLSPVAP
ncbi:hypothetical protein EJB05_21837 [Eragrostis curvula]|uniref:Cytochrome P450 n=1 Tax=Eragrostis curvula TaxID=38414 RepID=A0A5J9V491_9POAL|nr:hypothetical protein EJB05_21837 [Eragrostis curvula]